LPNYIDPTIAQLTEILGDCPPELIDLYALLVHTTGVTTTLEDVHEAWAIWRNRTNPAHKSLIPFDELTLEVQEYDRKYMDAIHKVALDRMSNA
jgi:hypothetical protein